MHFSFERALRFTWQFQYIIAPDCPAFSFRLLWWFCSVWFIPTERQTF